MAAESSTPPRDRLRNEPVPLAARVLILLTILWSLFFALGTYRTFSSHEAYVVVPARAMMESGDWIVPDYAGVPRLTKPPGMYWLTAGFASATGVLNEWVARIPVALSALALAGLIGFWAGKWYGRRVGWAAFLVQATCEATLSYGRRAEMDIPLVLLITAALFLFIQSPPEQRWRSGLPRWTTILLLIAISWLLKFHYGPAMIIGPVVIFLIAQKRFRDFVHFANPLGLLFVVAAVAAWPLAVLHQNPQAWEIWRRETLGRATGELGTQPLWYYLPVALMFTLPWTPFWIARLRTIWQQIRTGNDRERFLAIWFAVDLGILLVSQNKHANYLLAIVPVFSLWAAPALVNWLEKLKAGTARTQRIPVFASIPVLVIGCGVAGFLLGEARPQLHSEFIVIGILFAVGTAAMTWFAARRDVFRAGIASAMCFVGVTAVTFLRVSPAMDHRAAAAVFARHTRANNPDRTILLYGINEDPEVWYLGRPARRIGTQIPNSAQPAIVIARESDLDAIRKRFRIEVLCSTPNRNPHRGGSSPLVAIEISPREQTRTAGLRRQAN